MTPYAVAGASVIVPAKIAALLEQHLGLDELRISVRGRNPELDGVLSAWHAVALAYRTDRAACDPTASANDKSPQVAALSEGHLLGSVRVAAAAGVTTSAVTLAARLGQLRGQRIGRRWEFQREDVQVWLDTRRST